MCCRPLAYMQPDAAGGCNTDCCDCVSPWYSHPLPTKQQCRTLQVHAGIVLEDCWKPLSTRNMQPLPTCASPGQEGCSHASDGMGGLHGGQQASGVMPVCRAKTRERGRYDAWIRETPWCPGPWQTRAPGVFPCTAPGHLECWQQWPLPPASLTPPAPAAGLTPPKLLVSPPYPNTPSASAPKRLFLLLYMQSHGMLHA